MLTASHLTRTFGTRTAVDDVSFELRSREILALLGPNGAGKTTTLRMLAGLISPTSGEVRVGGDTIAPTSAPALRRRIGFLPEVPGLWDRLTVGDNLLVYARLFGLTDPMRAVNEALDLFDLGDRRADAAGQLSKGLKQRVAVARALLHRPDIVLLDEPTAGLDPESAREVRALVLRLRSEGRAVLISTHNLDEVDRVADRVALLRSRLVALDTPRGLRARVFGARVRVVLGQRAGSFARTVADAGFPDVRDDDDVLSVGVIDARSSAAVIVKRLVEAGADIVSVSAEQPPLEEVYVRLLDEGRQP